MAYYAVKLSDLEYFDGLQTLISKIQGVQSQYEQFNT